MSFPTHGNITSRNPDAITTKITNDPSIQKTIDTIKYLSEIMRILKSNNSV